MAIHFEKKKKKKTALYPKPSLWILSDSNQVRPNSRSPLWSEGLKKGEMGKAYEPL